MTGCLRSLQKVLFLSILHFLSPISIAEVSFSQEASPPYIANRTTSNLQQTPLHNSTTSSETVYITGTSRDAISSKMHSLEIKLNSETRTQEVISSSSLATVHLTSSPWQPLEASPTTSFSSNELNSETSTKDTISSSSLATVNLISSSWEVSPTTSFSTSSHHEQDSISSLLSTPKLDSDVISSLSIFVTIISSTKQSSQQGTIVTSHTQEESFIKTDASSSNQVSSIKETLQLHSSSNFQISNNFVISSSNAIPSEPSLMQLQSSASSKVQSFYSFPVPLSETISIKPSSRHLQNSSEVKSSNGFQVSMSKVLSIKPSSIQFQSSSVYQTPSYSVMSSSAKPSSQAYFISSFSSLASSMAHSHISKESTTYINSILSPSQVSLSMTDTLEIHQSVLTTSTSKLEGSTPRQSLTTSLEETSTAVTVNSTPSVVSTVLPTPTSDQTEESIGSEVVIAVNVLVCLGCTIACLLILLTILMNLCLCQSLLREVLLLFRFCFMVCIFFVFLFTAIMTPSRSAATRITMSAFIHFLLLSACFLLVGMVAVLFWVVAKNTNFTKLPQRYLILVGLLVSFGIPAFVTVVTGSIFGGEYVQDTSDNHLLSHLRGMYWSLCVPVIIITISTTFLIAPTVYLIYIINKSVSERTLKAKCRKFRKRNRSIIQMLVLLGSLVVLVDFIIIFMIVVLNDDTSVGVACLYAMLAVVIGVLLFLFYGILNEQVRNNLLGIHQFEYIKEDTETSKPISRSSRASNSFASLHSTSLAANRSTYCGGSAFDLQDVSIRQDPIGRSEESIREGNSVVPDFKAIEPKREDIPMETISTNLSDKQINDERNFYVEFPNIGSTTI